MVSTSAAVPLLLIYGKPQKTGSIHEILVPNENVLPNLGMPKMGVYFIPWVHACLMLQPSSDQAVPKEVVASHSNSHQTQWTNSAKKGSL